MPALKKLCRKNRDLIVFQGKYKKARQNYDAGNYLFQEFLPMMDAAAAAKIPNRATPCRFVIFMDAPNQPA